MNPRFMEIILPILKTSVNVEKDCVHFSEVTKAAKVIKELTGNAQSKISSEHYENLLSAEDDDKTFKHPSKPEYTFYNGKQIVYKLEFIADKVEIYDEGQELVESLVLLNEDYYPSKSDFDYMFRFLDKLKSAHVATAMEYVKGLPPIKSGDLNIPSNSAIFGEYSFSLDESDIMLFERKDGKGYVFKIPEKYNEKVAKAEGNKDPYVLYNGHKWKYEKATEHGYIFILIHK